MNQVELTQNAKDFFEYWQDKGDEKQETQRYWIELLQNVLGIENPSRYIEFEKTVKIKHTNFIDAYISSTKVLIEQNIMFNDFESQIIFLVLINLFCSINLLIFSI